MQRLVYILVYPLLYLVSLLPFRCLYILSDLVFILVYYVIGYRKKVVTDNLKLVFPDKSVTEIKSIRKRFYRHMCDLFLEMIKSITVNPSALVRRFQVKNPEELHRLESKGKSFVIMFGHYASYEWSNVVGNYINYEGYTIYKPLKNIYFDRLVKRIRSKFNVGLISSREAVNTVKTIAERGKPSIIGFISDQSPKSPKRYHRIDFMGISVPCFTGAETLAKQFSFPVGYLKIEKVKRGYYEVEIITLADDPQSYPDFEITEKFTRALEEQIRNAPEYYLWTHKRWKHRKS
ncbi:MAG: lysophospholipid acyltransferase family protein [Flavobacteriaceae bacterium]|nr:lysophospholipid acyltransferase family protein [Flavobacteriaceae bacterium]